MRSMRVCANTAGKYIPSVHDIKTGLHVEEKKCEACAQAHSYVCTFEAGLHVEEMKCEACAHAQIQCELGYGYL